MSESVEREEEGSDKQHIHRPESPTASCVSKDDPPHFSNEPGPPHLKSVYHRPVSPTPSCVSMKSDWSKGRPPDFSNEPGPPDTKSVYHRPESPTPSCVSMKSDWSKGIPPNFSNEPGPPDTKSVYHRPESPTPSCVSMKSDWSKGIPPNFSNEPGPPDTKSVYHRPESPTPSCVSMKSNWSKGRNPDFSNEPGPPDTKVDQHRSGSPVPSCVSMKSDWSMSRPITFKDEHHSTDHRSVYHRPESPTPSCVSMQSDRSKGEPPNFSNEHGPPKTKCSGETFTTTPGLKTSGQTSCGQTDVSLQEHLKDYKISLNSLECVTEHITEETGTSLTEIYTELYVTVGESEGVNNQHEVWQIETLSKKKTLHDKPINCCDIFKPLLLGRETPIRRVLTKGIAGIGKTFSVRKFTLDWAKGLENQDVILLVPFSFRELNLVKDEQHSLLTLIHIFHPTLEKVTAEQLAVWKVGFIFDGLDESRFSLNFHSNDIIYDVTVISSVDVLLTNLIEGNLLPLAVFWITTRPAAANQIPPACVDMVTEVRGFTDPQKEEFFMKRFSDEKLASTIISHMKTSKSIHIMCHIPVFCSITATVLEDMLKTDKTGQLPKTLTQMYSHLLLVQTNRKKQKYDDESHEQNQQQLMETDREVLLKLGRLAFEHLQKSSIMFYQEDLEGCGLDVKDASLYSGVCTEIFKRESVVFQKTVYSFVHLSIQEFLAAVYLFHCFKQRNMEVLKTFLEDDDYNSDSSLSDFLKAAMKKSLQSENGHLDLFVRFLHGLSLESNQSLLGDLLGQTENSPEEIKRAINNLKEMVTDHDTGTAATVGVVAASAAAAAGLIAGIGIGSVGVCVGIGIGTVAVAVAAVVVDGDDDGDGLAAGLAGGAAGLAGAAGGVAAGIALAGGNDDTVNAAFAGATAGAVGGIYRGIAADIALAGAEVGGAAAKAAAAATINAATAIVATIVAIAAAVAGAIAGGDAIVALIVAATVAAIIAANVRATTGAKDNRRRKLNNLKKKLNDSFSPDRCINIFHCLMEMNDPSVSQGIQQYLESKSRSGKKLSQTQCSALATMLQMSEKVLEVLDLDKYNTDMEGRHKLIPAVRNCTTARLVGCDLQKKHIEVVASALSSNPSHLRHLDLSSNCELNLDPLCDALKNPHCRLETLRLVGCDLQKKHIEVVASALSSNPSHLRHLDLSDNGLDLEDLDPLCDALKNPHCRLVTLRVKHEGELWTNPQLFKRYLHPLTLDTNTAHRNLCLSENNRKVTRVSQAQSYPPHPDRFDDRAYVMCTEGLTGFCYWEVEWSGTVDIAVIYREFNRKGSDFGRNDKSWTLACYHDANKYTVRHNSRHTDLPVRPSGSHRVVVYLDWPARALSFYRVSFDTLTHLYTFQNTFTQPLYPAFNVEHASSVSLCQER